MKAETSKLGGTLALVTIARRNIWRNKRRTLLCVAAVGIAVFFTILMQSMITGMVKSVEDVVKVFDTGHVSAASSGFEADKEYMPVQYPVGGGRPFDELSAAIKTIPGVKAVFPRISAFATLQDSTIKHAMLMGLNIKEETAVNRFNQTERTDGLLAGRWPEDANECAVGAAFAEKGRLKIGDKIPLKTVSAQFSDKMWSPVIVGIFDFDYLKYDREVIIVDYQRLQRLLVLDGGAQQIFVFCEKSSQSREVAAQMRELLGPDDVVRDWKDNYFVAMMQQSMGVFYVIELVFLIVASFLIVNTVVMIIHERIKEIGMMGSLGMTRREIVEVFFFEAVFLSVLGAVSGVLAGGALTFIGSLFPFDFNAMMGGGFTDYPMSGTLFLAFNGWILLTGFLFGVAVSSVCTLIPSLRSAFVEPVEALRR